jgi:hypothetical protein
MLASHSGDQWTKWHQHRTIPSSSVLIIPPLLYTHLSLPHEMRASPDQAAHYHTLGPKLGASSLTEHVAYLGVNVVILNHYRKNCQASHI